MINGVEVKVNKVSGIKPEEEQRMLAFLQGHVYCWCNTKGNEWFSASSFLGGDNFFWERTPMFPLFKKHSDQGKDGGQAIKDAGKDAGWLLKKVLSDDKRNFEDMDGFKSKSYRWIKE